MGLFSKCSWCGKRMPHTCFRGGTRVAIGYSENDLKTAARTVAFNEMRGATGKARMKGVSKDLQPLLEFDGAGQMRQHLRDARSAVKKRK